MEDYVVIFVRVIAAIIQGGAIGLERQRKHRPAGFRTHIVVCLSSAVIMMLSEGLFVQYYTKYDVAIDPNRLTAQVITGIGFIGAGTIIHYGKSVKGLTTAASLWAVSAIGMATGAGFYALSITASVSLFLILFLFSGVKSKYESRSSISLSIEMYNKPKTMGNVNFVFAAANVKILDMSFLEDDDEDKEEEFEDHDIIVVRFVISPLKNILIAQLIQEIKNVSGVINVEKS